MKRLSLVMLIAVCLIVLVAPAAGAAPPSPDLPRITGDIWFNVYGCSPTEQNADCSAHARFQAYDLKPGEGQDGGSLYYKDAMGYMKMRVTTVRMDCDNLNAGGMGGVIIASTHPYFPVGFGDAWFWLWDRATPGNAGPRPDLFAANRADVPVLAGDGSVVNWASVCAN